MKLLGSIWGFCRKNDSIIFAVAEVGLATAAVIFAVKNTSDYIEDREAEIDQGPKPAQEKAKDIVTHYWPTMVCYGSLVALRSLDAVVTKRTQQEYAKALVAAQSALLARFRGPQKGENAQNEKNVPAEVGPQGDEMIDIRGEKAWDDYAYMFFLNNDELPEAETSAYLPQGWTNAAQEFYIPSLGILFYSTMEDIQMAENSCRCQVCSGNDMSMNEMLKYLGLGSRGNMGIDLYIEGDPKDNDIYGDFSFDLAPASIDLNDGFGSKDLCWTINPNRTIRNHMLA